MSQTTLQCRKLDVTINNLLLIARLDMDIHAGDLVAIIGCNGAGKSTLIHTLAGLHDGDGKIELLGRPVADFPPMELARKMALLQQKQEDAFPATVFETVLMGRHPHVGFWQWESGQDIAITNDCLAQMDLAELAQRSINELSGGERQRVAIASALAQKTKLFLLDEPLNNLDPKHQLRVLKHFRQLTRDGSTVVMILHDLNLVWRFADKVLCLHGPGAGGRWQAGTPDDCLTSDKLSDLYQTPIQRLNNNEKTFFIAGD
ncbi:MAG: ABC transporter ATP-binding protein [Gammaproteobacteria bacterium]|nr:ABC transporter ATP-binding protein [Gammaproteobacteria bacterium]